MRLELVSVGCFFVSMKSPKNVAHFLIYHFKLILPCNWTLSIQSEIADSVQLYYYCFLKHSTTFVVSRAYTQWNIITMNRHSFQRSTKNVIKMSLPKRIWNTSKLKSNCYCVMKIMEMGNSVALNLADACTHHLSALLFMPLFLKTLPRFFSLLFISFNTNSKQSRLSHRW